MLVAATACLLGFANGMRHAFEPDHLAAVSTMVAGERSPRASVRFAAAWGAGHAATLLVAGGALALLRRDLPERASDGLELAVSVVLIVLGVRGVLAARQPRATARRSMPGPVAAHHHGAAEHSHPGVDDHVHVSRWTLARLPFMVGLVHGLAGSGALAALVASHASAPFALAFIAIYGVGAMAGMAALAGLLGWPLARLAQAPRAVPVLLALSGVASLVVGVLWAAPILGRLAS